MTHCNQSIELVNAALDLTKCNWKNDDYTENVFWLVGNNKVSPIFSFVFHNYYDKELMLNSFDLNIKFLPAGLSGVTVPLRKSEPKAKHCFNLQNDNNDYSFSIVKRVAPHEHFTLQTEFLLPNMTPLTDRYSLQFSFNFNNRTTVKAPLFLLNSNNSKGELEYLVFS